VVRCGKDGSDVLAAGKDDPTSLLSDCRILRKDDLQVVRGNAAPRVPDCFQRTPKKIVLPEMGQIQATAVDTQGILIFSASLVFHCFQQVRERFLLIPDSMLFDCLMLNLSSLERFIVFK